jgi:hypothetical protein
VDFDMENRIRKEIEVKDRFKKENGNHKDPV